MQRLFETSKDIAAPADQVWDAISDVERWPEWTPTVTSVRRLDEGPFGVGSRVEIRQPKLPKAQWTVTEVVDGRSFTWEATGPGMRSVARHVVTPREGGATITLSVEQLGPMGAVAAVVWRGITQRYVETEAESLDRRVHETHPA
jgi:uncharacterized protein YndB with AHSA1/START domain